MKKFLAFFLTLTMVLTCVSAFADNVIKIGVYEPASGSNGAGGKQEVLGIEYAHTLKPTVTLNGTEYAIELVEVDNCSDDDKGVSAVGNLVGQNVSIILGSYGSSVSIAAHETLELAQIPAIGLSCTNSQVTDSDYYWRICFLDPFQGTVMANFANSIGATKAYVMAELGNAYDVGLAQSFMTAFQALGFEVEYAPFNAGTSDFASFITSAVNGGFNVIFSPCSVNYASLIIDQAASQNVAFPIMAGDTWESSVILDAAKGKNVKVYCSTFFDDKDDSGAASEFVAGFKAWLNANEDKKTNNGGNDIVAAVSALGFDGYNTAVAAIEAAGSAAPADLIDALPALVYENAVTGTIKFDAKGDAEKNMAYIKFANPETYAFDFVKIQTVD